MKINIPDGEIRRMLKSELNREPTEDDISILRSEASRNARQWLRAEVQLLIAARKATEVT